MMPLAVKYFIVRKGRNYLKCLGLVTFLYNFTGLQLYVFLFKKVHKINQFIRKGLLQPKRKNKDKNRVLSYSNNVHYEYLYNLQKIT